MAIAGRARAPRVSEKILRAEEGSAFLVPGFGPRRLSLEVAALSRRSVLHAKDIIAAHTGHSEPENHGHS
jgi:hypothetical protein